MILIVGLGNPSKKYEKTRHNVGFMVLDTLTNNLGVTFKVDRGRGAQIAEYTVTFEGQKKKAKVAMIKPQTYMNNSGETVRKVAKYYQIKPQNIWVIHDDLDIDLGTIRIRLGGGSAGQKGVQSIIDQLGTKDFYRFRFGIRPPEGQKINSEEFVLGKFSKDERVLANKKINELVEILLKSIDRGPEKITV